MKKTKSANPIISRTKSSLEDINEIVSKIKKVDKYVKPNFKFKNMGGIPHKFKNGSWVPLTKI